jgi:transcriptional regulator with XRE-family HTH domain
VWTPDRTRAANRCQARIRFDDRMTTVHNPIQMPDHSPAAGETIGQRLKRLRLQRSLSQRELAAPGVSYAYISRIEAGTRQPSVKALRRLAAKLGVSAAYLETGSDLDPTETRELQLSDIELAIRLGEKDSLEAPLRALVADAVAHGDHPCALRARVALAAIAQDRGDFTEAVELLEAALDGEAFDPVSMVDIYSQLARAYVGSGRTRDAVDLFERCLAEVIDGDAALEARYATLLSYALSDVGEIARAEDVVQHALERSKDTEDPYTRVRLYWSMARLAHTEGRPSVALANVRKAIALLQATEDTLHLARAHILAAGITLSREDADSADHHLDQAEHLLGGSAAAEDLIEIKIRRSHVATLRGEAKHAITAARDALAIIDTNDILDRGLAHAALANGLALNGDVQAADEAFTRAVDLLVEQGRWRDATNACRAWARMLREQGDEQRAIDVLDRAAELGTRAAPEGARTGH